MSGSFTIGVVGPCTSGKSTLVASLREEGYTVFHLAQEHSYVADMWQRLRNPDILIYLDVQLYAAQERRKIDWRKKHLDQQQSRLAHAREHANFYLDTSDLTIDEVRQHTLDFLSSVDFE